MKRSWKMIVLWVIVGGLVLFGLIQLVPYGHDTSNPPIVKEPNWDSPQTRELAKRACFDCHSNETKRWWATKIAPFSWLAQSDVDGARSTLNFSDWQSGRGQEDLYEVIQSGSMPPLQYTIPHPNAKLSDSEKQQLIDGLKATAAQTP